MDNVLYVGQIEAIKMLWLLLWWSVVLGGVVGLNVWRYRIESHMTTEEKQAANDNAHYELQTW